MTATKKTSRIPFAPIQRKILFALASVVGLRMLGLFLVLPVFTLYGLQFTKSYFLVGVAFSSYALVMALLQIPLGRLSDRIGRRKVLMIGMTLFSLGSFVCAVPHWFPHSMQIGALIAGRLIQGGGAIVSVAFATVADHVEEKNRSTAMAVLGIPIGVAFIVGIVAGPIIAGWFGTASLFWLTGFLGLGTDFLLYSYLPATPPKGGEPAPIGEVIRNRRLIALDCGGFLMNFFMTTFFYFFPLLVTVEHHVKMTRYYEILLPMIFISAVTMFAFTRGADKGWATPLAAVAFLIFVPSSLLLFGPSLVGFGTGTLTAVLVGGTLFYIGFTGLEPMLPAMVSKSGPKSAYGTSLGVYNSVQFLGSAVAGPLAGALAARHNPMLIMCILIGTSIIGSLLVFIKPQV
jgi:MFS family permease